MSTSDARARRPRVMHIVAAPEFVTRIMRFDLARLRDRCDQVVVCTDGAELDSIRRDGFRVAPVSIARKMDPIADLTSLRRLTMLIKREKPDLVHTYAPKAGLLGQLAASAAGVRARIHGCRGLLYESRMSPTRRRIMRTTDTVTNRLAHRTLYLSRADRDYSVSEGLCTPAKAELIGSGIDTALFDDTRVSPQSGAGVRARFGIAPDAELVLSVGRYVWDKGYAEIAEAVPAIVRSRPGAHFLWVAPILQGEEGVPPADFLESLGIANRVTIVGLQDDMPAIYRAADVLLHVSHREGVPRTVMEAAAMNVPLVVSDIPGCREIVTGPELGIVVPVRDPRAIERAVIDVLSNTEASRKRARSARAAVRERFDQDALTDRVWRAYEALLLR